MALAYDPSLEAADLVLTGKVFKKDKEKTELAEQKIADATIITPLMVRKEFGMLYQKDELVRVVNKSVSAVINFDKGKSLVKSKEIKDEDIKTLVTWIDSAQNNSKIEIESISVLTNRFLSPSEMLSVAANCLLNSSKSSPNPFLS